jgi:hypothetical protein
MPRRPRLAAGDLAYHVLKRRMGRLPLEEAWGLTDGYTIRDGIDPPATRKTERILKQKRPPPLFNL